MRDDLDIPMPSMAPGGASTTSFRVQRQPEGLDPNTKRMAVIAAAIVGVFVVFAGVYSFMGHRRAGVPVVEADSRPLREKPKDAGGMQVAGKDETIMSGTSETKAAISGPAEAPAPQALRTAPVVTPAPLATPQVAAAPTSAVPVAAPSVAVAPVKPTATPNAVPSATPIPAAPATTAKVAMVDPKAASKPVTQAAPTPSVLGTAKPAQAAPAPAPTPAKGVQVQLAAVGSEAAAHAEWQRLAKRMPELFNAKSPAISKVERDGKTMWRVRTGGFADTNAAKAFCETVKAKASGCIVAS
jgi:hypothetical protein